MKKRFLAGLLSFAMIFSLMPSTVTLAEDDMEGIPPVETQVDNTEEVSEETDTRQEETENITQLENVQDTEEVPAAESEADAQSEAVQELQARIDALPSPEEFEALADGTTVEDSTLNQAQMDVYNEAQSIAEAVDSLTDGEQGQLDTGKLEALFEYFNGQVSESGTTPITYPVDSYTPLSNHQFKYIGYYRAEGDADEFWYNYGETGTVSFNRTAEMTATSDEHELMAYATNNNTPGYKYANAFAIFGKNSNKAHKNAWFCTNSGLGTSSASYWYTGYEIFSEKKSGKKSYRYDIRPSREAEINSNTKLTVGTDLSLTDNGKTVKVDITVRNDSGADVNDQVFAVGSSLIFHMKQENSQVKDQIEDISGSYGKENYHGQVFNIKDTAFGGTKYAMFTYDDRIKFWSGTGSRSQQKGSKTELYQSWVTLSSDEVHALVKENQMLTRKGTKATYYDYFTDRWYVDNAKNDYSFGTCWYFVPDLKAGESQTYTVYIGVTPSDENMDDLAKSVKGVVHTHDWQYGLSSDKSAVTAYCKNANPDEECNYDTAHKLTLSLKAEDKAYTGKAYAGAGIDKNDITPVTEAVAGAVTYYLADGKTKTNSSNSGAASQGAAPVNVGSYVAKVTLGGVTAEKAFQIEKADAAITVTPVNGLVYNGKEQKLVTAKVTGGTAHYRLGTDGAWSTDIPAAVSAEDSPYTVYYYVTGDSNHNDYASEENPASVTAQIARKEFPDSDITVSDRNIKFTYNKAPHTIDEVTLSGEAADATITYSLEKNGTYTDEKPEFTQVKTTGSDKAYTVYYKVSKTQYADKIGSATVTIEPKPVSVTWSHTDDLIYNGKAQKPEATAGDLCEGDSCEITVDGAQTDYKADGYDAKASGVSNPNYTLPGDASVIAHFMIAQKEIGMEWTHTDDLIYNGSEQKPTATATEVCEGDSVEITVDGAQKNAGTDYTAEAVAVDNDNYKLPKDTTTQFVINKKSLTADTVEVSMTGDGITGSLEDGYQFSWDGGIKEPAIAVRDTETGETLAEDADYSLSGTTSEEEIGGYRVILKGSGNYTDRVAVKWSIVKTAIHPQVSITGWTYGDTPDTPEITGAQVQGDVTYTYYKDKDCTIPTTKEDGAEAEGRVPSNAGTYWVKAEIAETEYYAPAQAAESFTIEKRAVTVTPKAGQSKIYGDLDPELKYDAKLVGDDELSGSLSRTAGENVGTYEITQGTLSSDNYDITVAGGVNFTVKQKTLTSDMISLKQVNYAFTGKRITPEYRYHDDTTEVSGTGITESDVTFSGQTYSSDYGVYKVNIKGQGNYTGKINKTWCISPVQDVETGYDGNDHQIIISDTQDVELKFADEDGNYTVNPADIPSYKNPGEYTYKYKMVIDKDTDFEETVEGYAILKINKAPLSGLTLEMPDEIGYKDKIEPSVKNAGDGEITYYYKPKDADDSAYTTEKPENTGDYTVKAVIKETGFYEGGEITKDFTITPGTLESRTDTIYFGKKDSGKQTLAFDELYASLDGVNYTVGNYEDPDGVIKAGSVKVEDEKLNYDLTGGCDEDATVTIPVTISSTNYKDVTIYVTIVIDATAPTGTITVGQNAWHKFWNTISFNVFYKNTKDVTISGEDASGDVDIWYYVADKEMPEEEVKALPEADWTKGNAFTISEKNSYVIYSRLSDRFGNTSYISSEGIVFYEDSKAETTRISYVRKSDKDVSAKIALNGNTVKDIKVNGVELIPDDDYSVASDGTITFKAAYLEELAASETPYMVTVSYYPAGRDYVDKTGNEAPADTELSLSVTRNQGSIQKITDISKEYDTKAVEAPEVVSTNDISADRVKVEYKKASDKDDAYTTTVPKDAGDYVVRVTVSQDDDYAAVSKTAEFTVSPKPVKASVTAENKTYDGSKEAKVNAEVNTGIEGEALTITGLSGTFADANVGTDKKVAVNSGSAKVSAANESTLASNYTVSYQTEAEASIEAKKIGITWSNTTFTYDEKSHVPTAEATGLFGKDTCGITVSGAQTDAGNYTAQAVSLDNANYKLPADTTTEFVIERGDAALAVSAVADKNYKDSAFDLEVSHKGDGKVSYASSNEKVASVDENGKVTINGAGNVTITVSLAQDKNYNADLTSVTFTVKKIGNTLTVTKTTYDVSYGDEPFKIGAAAEDEASVKFESSDDSVASVDENGTVTIKKAGTALITITTEESSNYTPVSKTIEINVAPKAATVTVDNASKHATKEDPEFTYSVNGLVGNDKLSGITVSRQAGEAAGTYVISATQKAGENADYDITFEPGTFTIEDHVRPETPVEENRTEASCTENGSYDEVYYCTVDGCGAEIERVTKTIPALGHDWSGEWTVIKAATETEEGKQEKTCLRGCGQKKYDVIPKIGSTENTDAGKLQKDVEIEKTAPLKQATMNNSKAELIEASGIFTAQEKQAIQNGVDARVWMEISKTDESTIAAADKESVEKEAEKIMGANPTITYFDADLFKQVGEGETTQIHKPGKDINISILIPDELLNHDITIVREYKIIRLHIDEATGASQVDVIGGTFDENTNEFTFATDRFSTYAIVYNDVPKSTADDTKNDGNGNGNGNGNGTQTAISSEVVTDTKTSENQTAEITGANAAPKTGDTNTATVGFMVLLLGLAVLAQGLKKKNKF